jgi:hypothetical protein
MLISEEHHRKYMIMERNYQNDSTLFLFATTDIA